ncbi:MAG: polynucleotide kinase-phosphatase [Prochloron sp. SP5CPC1]|nr:polynucleotide kinase-phosphatase [Candidatus Paraprochloron terpiosi SP5CPC1]
MDIKIPELSLIVLIGVSGSGKSTFARKHFQPTEVISSDTCRGLVSDDETDQGATKDAFEVLHFIAAKRLAGGRLTVIDATNVKTEDRKLLLNLAKQYHFFSVAIAFNLPPKLCHERNKNRPERQFGPQVVHSQSQYLRRGLNKLKREGFRYHYILSSVEEIDKISIHRQPLWNNLRQEHGPFDIIGDIHGCYDELEALLQNLGYQITAHPNPGSGWYGPVYHHSEGRKAVFLGDLVDRGPKILATLKLVRNMVELGSALCVPGNHDMKLVRKLEGRNVQVKHGLAQTLAELEPLSEEFKQSIAAFLNSIVSHYVLDQGKLVVAHAGMKESMQGRGSGQVRSFALYGETTGETDEFGLPVRYEWAKEYRGQALVVYGHTPVPEPEWLNNTIDIDTGCVFGGKLTALRYPEKELVSVAAGRTYSEPVKPFLLAKVTPSLLTTQQQLDDVLELEDLLVKRTIETRLGPRVTIREENARTALEVMSRFAVNPKWLIYLPPTMSPSETSSKPGLLEYPTEAFAYYRRLGVSQVICEEKHMGSRGIVIVCRHEEAAQRRFGVVDEGIGICYSRTGRRFFKNPKLEQEVLTQLQGALTKGGFWEDFETDWVCLDCEIMPWSVKAEELIREQYAAVGVAARVALSSAVSLLQQGAVRGLNVGEILTRYQEKEQLAQRYVQAYRPYCWEVNGIEDLKLAPFHLLATEGAVYRDKDHLWHLNILGQICCTDPLLMTPTEYKVVDTKNPESEAEAIKWWEELTAAGGEGMVVKPLSFIAKSKRGLMQPALKCRGQEYLRIIYGLEYTISENLERLRQRGLSRKRSLALKEFCLGMEALERFVEREPLRRVHECVFAILALESEPVDPRL